MHDACRKELLNSRLLIWFDRSESKRLDFRHTRDRRLRILRPWSQPFAARPTGMDHDVGIKQHGTSRTCRHSTIAPHLTLPLHRILDALEWIRRTKLRQNLPTLGYTLLRLTNLVLDEQRHLHLAGFYPTRKRTTQSHRAVRSDYSLCLQRGHKKPLPHHPTPVNPTQDVTPQTSGRMPYAVCLMPSTVCFSHSPPGASRPSPSLKFPTQVSALSSPCGRAYPAWARGDRGCVWHRE